MRLAFPPRTGDYSSTAERRWSFTAGFPRKPGMSRGRFAERNYDVVKAVVEQIVKHSPRNCIIIVGDEIRLTRWRKLRFKVSASRKTRVLGPPSGRSPIQRA